MNENKPNNTKLFNGLSVILILIIIVLLTYILYTPISNLFTNKLNSDKILTTDNEIIKNNIKIEKFKIDNKELILLTNNNDQTVYDINVMGFFYDNNEKPMTTDSSTYLYFIPAGQTVAVELYCYDENKKIQDFGDCIVDINFAVESDTTNKYFVAMNDKLSYSDLNVTNEDNLLIMKNKIKNTSDSKINIADLILVLYKDNSPVATTWTNLRNISENEEIDNAFIPIPNVDYDDYKIFVQSCYKYSYN